jgi:hypothetical protein
MTTSRDRPSPTLLLPAAIVIAAAAGGALGVTVVRSVWFPSVPVLLGGLVLVALAGIVLARAGRSDVARDRDRTRQAEDPAEAMACGVTADPAVVPAARPAAAGPAEDPVEDRLPPEPGREHLHLVLPVPSDRWWGEGTGPVDPEDTAAARHARPRELSSYLRTSLIAQCPRCGGFHLVAEAIPPGYRFGCRACEFVWDWQSGQPWPAVRVDPRRRRTDAAGTAET